MAPNSLCLPWPTVACRTKRTSVPARLNGQEEVSQLQYAKIISSCFHSRVKKTKKVRCVFPTTSVSSRKHQLANYVEYCVRGDAGAEKLPILSRSADLKALRPATAAPPLLSGRRRTRSSCLRSRRMFRRVELVSHAAQMRSLHWYPKSSRLGRSQRRRHFPRSGGERLRRRRRRWRLVHGRQLRAALLVRHLTLAGGPEAAERRQWWWWWPSCRLLGIVGDDGIVRCRVFRRSAGQGRGLRDVLEGADLGESEGR